MHPMQTPTTRLLARMDRALGCLPGENYSRMQDEIIENERAMIAELGPLISSQPQLRGEFNDKRMLRMQRFVKGQLKKWVGRVADNVLIQVQCYAITLSTFETREDSWFSRHPVYVRVQDPRIEVTPYAKYVRDCLSDRLQYRASPYWDDALDYFLDDSKDAQACTYTLAGFMKYTGFTRGGGVGRRYCRDV